VKFWTIAIAVAALCVATSALAANVETYKYHKDLERSPLFSVKVNGIEQTVIDTPEPGVCNFGCDGAVEVEVSYLGGAAESWALRPLNKKYPSSVEGNTIKFTLNPLEKAVVEVNGDETRPLFVFANPPEKKKKDATYYFRAGKIYKDMGNLSLMDGESIYIEGGAAVFGKINVKGKSNLTIDGCGILYTPDEFKEDGSLSGNKKLIFEDCRDIVLNNITVINVSNWTTLFAECRNIVSDNYKVVATFTRKDNGRGNENDGFDLLGSSYAKITNAFSYCHDDAFCVKSQKWNWAGVAHDISFENCIGWNNDSGNTFEIGYELNQEVFNISYKNMYAVHSAGYYKEFRRGAIGIQNGAGGSVHDIKYENIYIEDAKEYGIYLRILKSDYNIGTDVTWEPGRIYNISMKNIVIEKMPKYKNYLSGYDSAEHAIRNLTIDGLYIEGKKETDWSSFNKNNYSEIHFVQ